MLKCLLSKYVNKTACQSLTLLLATVFSMLFLVGINFLLTRILDTEQYGNYSFIVNIFVFSQTLFNFGFFYSICRLISISENDVVIRSYYYVGIIIWGILSVIMCLSLLIYSLFTENFENNDILGVFLSILPLGSVYLYTSFNEIVLQGDNRINLLSVSRVFPRVIFFSFLLIFYQFNNSRGLLGVLVLYFVSYIIVYLYLLFKIRPVAFNVKIRFKEIFSLNKEYGLPIYIGSLFAVGASNFMGVLLGMLSVDNTAVGFYNIALQLSIPLSMLPNILATVLYKKFVFSRCVSKKVLLTLLLLSVLIYICILCFSKPFISIVFGDKYLQAVPLLKFMCFGALLYGIADFFNKFLLSKGKGKMLRNVSFIVGIVIVCLSYPFIKFWGGYGASYIKVIAGIVYMMVIMYMYRLTVKKENGN